MEKSRRFKPDKKVHESTRVIPNPFGAYSCYWNSEIKSWVFWSGDNWYNVKCFNKFQIWYRFREV